MKKYLSIFSVLFTFSHFALAQTTYLHCGKLYTGEEKSLLSEYTIIVDADTIVSIKSGYLTPSPAENATIINLKNKTVLPGLIDCHVHFEFEQSRNSYGEGYVMNESDVAYRALVYAQRTLDAGFTTVRDLGGTGVNTALRNAISKRWVAGPRIISANKALAITGGHGDHTNGARHDLFDPPTPSEGIADGPDECRKAVRTQVKYGADVIKITATGGVLSMAKDGRKPQFQEDELEAIVKTANDMGVKVAAHAHGDEGIERAVRAGVASIEHGTFMSDKSMDLMREKGTYYVPTLTAGWAVTDSAQVKGFFPEMVRVKALGIGPKIEETTGKVYKKGVKIAFGTDAGVFPHGNNGLEFFFMQRAGIPVMESLRMATYNAADLLGVLDKVGTLRSGKWADIIAVSGNPVEDVTAMQRVDFVMKGGKIWRQ